MNQSDAPVIIVGAGLAGLSCAVALHQQGIPVQLLDAADHVGGRVWTDEVEGFLLDRGFQVLNPAYPALAEWLPKLQLKPFLAGARIALPNGQFTTVADPLRHPQYLMQTLASPVGSWLDKLALLRMKAAACQGLPQNLHRLPPDDRSNTVALQLPCYASPEFMQRFFRPFFGGVLLETDGHTRWDYFLWLFNLFTQAQVSLPKGGMAALPKAMASQLPPDAIQLNTTVSAVAAQSVSLLNGTVLPARAVVVATDGHTATRLLGLPFNPGRRGVSCLYYAWHGPLPDSHPILWLNGRGEGLVNNWCFPSVVQPGYAPQGQQLLSVSVLGVPACADTDLDHLVQAELADLVPNRGPAMPPVRLLRVYRIPFAQPDVVATDVPQQVNGLWLAGDWLSTPSLQGALASGQAVATALAETTN